MSPLVDADDNSWSIGKESRRAVELCFARAREKSRRREAVDDKRVISEHGVVGTGILENLEGYTADGTPFKRT